MAISYILSSPTLEEAYRKARVSKGTLYIWLKDEAFKTELKRQRDEVVRDALDRLKSAMSKAVDGLIGLVESSRPNLRRWACKDIIDYTLRSIELEDIEERLDKVEHVVLGRKTYKNL